MAIVEYKKDVPLKDKVKIKQGDFIYCKANGGGCSFWGIYGMGCGVVSLDGAGSSYIPSGVDLYLGEIYNYWLIEKRIPCDKARITIDEIE